MHSERVDLRTIPREYEETRVLVWEGPVLLIDELLGLKLVPHDYGEHHTKRLIITAPRVVPITFDQENGQPVLHRLYEGGRGTGFSSQRHNFGSEQGKNKFFVGNRYAVAFKEYEVGRMTLTVASTEPLFIAEATALMDVREILQTLR